MAVAAIIIVIVVWRWYASLPQQLSATIGTLTAAAVGFLANRAWERQRDTERERRAKNIPVYESLLPFVFRSIATSKPGVKQFTEQEVIETFIEINPQLTVWASDDVLREYSKWRWHLLRVKPADSGTILQLFQLADLMLAIRKDVGQSNKGLSKVDVLRIFVNDIDAVLEKLINEQTVSRGAS